MTPIKTKSGKETLSFEGTWNCAGGTGKWDKSEGSGTYKGMFIGDGIYTINMVGEYIMKNK